MGEVLVRVQCPEHRVKTLRVPWEEPRSRFRLDFEGLRVAILFFLGKPDLHLSPKTRAPAAQVAPIPGRLART